MKRGRSGAQGTHEEKDESTRAGEELGTGWGLHKSKVEAGDEHTYDILAGMAGLVASARRLRRPH